MSKINIFSGGKSDYTILLPQKATENEIFAAEELVGILKMSTGYSFLITRENGGENDKFISVGGTEAFQKKCGDIAKYDLGNGGYVIKATGGNVYIHSTSESGKINGIYAFAERTLGYEYYCFDEIVCEEKEKVEFKEFVLVKKPAFDGRNVHSPHTVHNPLNAVRLKCSNVVGEWDKKYGQACSWSTLHDMSNVFQLLPLKKYYKDHPDWFFLTEEWRDKADTFAEMNDEEFRKIPQRHSQLCYTKGLYDDTEGGMFDTFVKNLIKYIQTESDKTLFMLGMGDNDYNCDCPKCKEEFEKYKVSGVTLRFVNKVARAVNKWLKEESGTPERKIYFVVFAYLTAMEPPVKKENGKFLPIDDSVVAEDNVCIRIAPLVNVNYYWEMTDPDRNAYMRDSISGWRQIAKHFTIWDYRAHYNYLVTQYPCWNTIKPNLLLYKEMGVMDIFHQAYSEICTPFIKMDDYVCAKLLFDLSLDVKELAEKFIDNYYKEAAPYIKEYQAYLRRHYQMVAVPNGYSGAIYHNTMQRKYWPLNCLLEMKVIFSKAYESIESLPDEKKTILKTRIDFDSRFYRYALLELYGEYFTKTEQMQMLKEWDEVNAVDPLKEHAVRHPIEEKTDVWRARAAGIQWKESEE